MSNLFVSCYFLMKNAHHEYQRFFALLSTVCPSLPDITHRPHLYLIKSINSPNPVLYSTILFSPLLYSTLLYSTLLYSISYQIFSIPIPISISYSISYSIPHSFVSHIFSYHLISSNLIPYLEEGPAVALYSLSSVLSQHEPS